MPSGGGGENALCRNVKPLFVEISHCTMSEAAELQGNSEEWGVPQGAQPLYGEIVFDNKCRRTTQVIEVAIDRNFRLANRILRRRLIGQPIGQPACALPDRRHVASPEAGSPGRGDSRASQRDSDRIVRLER